MIRECFKTNTGILFHADGLRNLGLDPDALWTNAHTRPPPAPLTSTTHIRRPCSPPPPADPLKTEEELELEDALSPIYDQLKRARPWWILEVIPSTNQYHNEKGKIKTDVALNLGRARIIPKPGDGLKIHRSVKMRMEAQYENGKKYIPRAKFDSECVTWVD